MTTFRQRRSNLRRTVRSLAAQRPRFNAAFRTRIGRDPFFRTRNFIRSQTNLYRRTVGRPMYNRMRRRLPRELQRLVMSYVR